MQVFSVSVSVLDSVSGSGGSSRSPVSPGTSTVGMASPTGVKVVVYVYRVVTVVQRPSNRISKWSSSSPTDTA